MQFFLVFFSVALVTRRLREIGKVDSVLYIDSTSVDGVQPAAKRMSYSFRQKKFVFF